MSFQAGLSGLNASSKALDVVGNNVANSSTVGFKSASAHFGDLYAASLTGSGASQIGIGTALNTVVQQFTQGNITTTSNTLDLAINGGGFFKVTNGTSVSYTRNGQFHTDSKGYVINDNGYKLEGYIATATGEIVASEPAAIQIDTGNISPLATGNATGGDATLKLNLNSSKSTPTVTTFDSTNPLSYTYSTSMTTYDTLGVEHAIRYYFIKGDTDTTTGLTSWTVHATLDGDSATDTTMGTLDFDSSGLLSSVTDSGGASTTTGVLALPSTWDITTGATTPLGSGLPNWNVDFSGSTSYSGESTVNAMTQGGYAQGQLSSLTVSDDGTIQGNYSNGQTKTLAQVVLSTFANPNGLSSIGNNLYTSTPASGQGLDSVPGAGTRGLLQSSAVEESNVDLTQELVNMITLQRNYQANAQSIKTQDQIMQTLVNLR
ncbi:flagellar hook protein FlgE [Propionivibrio dicarboxylicus]|uniref:Flagellar hook protein FlgE n=1 Tax=Propionivibrio dicarboxylicus TaxID=83767 RepID=A0A1G8HEY2_9RHOO|nr:flagellar hook protein FlgE [Propionivibrio dicarboxylicus]SDI05182.1 flagellar hook protein FlgE [Propionivibrio dicarboxylicus]